MVCSHSNSVNLAYLFNPLHKKETGQILQSNLSLSTPRPVFIDNSGAKQQPSHHNAVVVAFFNQGHGLYESHLRYVVRNHQFPFGQIHNFFDTYTRRPLAQDELAVGDIQQGQISQHSFDTALARQWQSALV